MTQVATRQRQPTPRRRSHLPLGVRVGLLLALVLVGWIGSVAFRVWYVARQDDRSPVDVIVVLGASQYDGTPTPVFAGRLDHALELYEEGVAPEITTVGSNMPGDRYTEAEAGKQYLVDRGVPESAIEAVPVGRDTWSSLKAVAKESKAQDWSSAVIVSDPWHEFRAREMAESLGMDVTTSPTRTGPIVQERITEFRSIVRETAAYVWWRISGGAPWSGPDLA